MTYNLRVLIFLTSLFLSLRLHAQVESLAYRSNSQKNHTLILAKKSKPTKKVMIKEGDRVSIVTHDSKELQGKVIQIGLNSIHLKNDSVSVEEIHIIKKRKHAFTQVVGVTALSIGALALLGGQMSDIGAEEATVIGSVFVVSSFLLLYQKSYNHKRWLIEIEK